MAVWDLRRLQQYLDKHEAGSLYIIYGEEEYLINEAQNLISEKVLAEGARDFNYDRFYYPDTDAVHVRDIAETLPMMCARRLVVYKNIDGLKEKDWDVLMPLLEAPLDTCTLILVGQKLDKRKKFVKRALDNGVVLELKRPFDNQIPAWIEYIAFQNDVTLHRDGIELIHQLVGSDLSEINAEMKKLKLYLGDKKQASIEDVMQVVSRARIDSIFDLTNAIGRNDRASALMHLARLLESGQNEVGALLLILRHVRILSSLRQGMKQGLTGKALSAKAGVPSFFLRQYLEQCRHWEDEKIEKTIASLYKTDKALKSSPVSSHIWLENFIVQSCTC